MLMSFYLFLFPYRIISFVSSHSLFFNLMSIFNDLIKITPVAGLFENIKKTKNDINKIIEKIIENSPDFREYTTKVDRFFDELIFEANERYIKSTTMVFLLDDPLINYNNLSVAIDKVISDKSLSESGKKLKWLKSIILR